VTCGNLEAQLNAGMSVIMHLCCDLIEYDQLFFIECNGGRVVVA
jgi:hypothetical protein